MPKWILYSLLILTVASLVPLAAISVRRAGETSDTRFSIIPDMDQQQKFKAQAGNALFADGRAMRPRIPGTIAQGELREDDHYYRGIVEGEWATTFPMLVDDAMMRRGKERYKIYCAPCHGLSGYGDGMVALRAQDLMEAGKMAPAWTPPKGYHDDAIRARPVGHIYNSITNGIRSMPAYGPQIPVEDRWAIVAYIRALQRSQGASIEDVPADYRETIEMQGEEAPSLPATETEAAEPSGGADVPAGGADGPVRESFDNGGRGGPPHQGKDGQEDIDPGGATPEVAPEDEIGSH
ncbi:cytochrome c [bacterium]|nr:cytochrome c [bacterium]